jgi:hypothetical protein
MKKWWADQLLEQDSLRIFQGNRCPRPNERIADVKAIVREERERTVVEIDKLPLSSRDRDDVLSACLAVRRAINKVIARSNGPVHQDVGLIALRLMTDEIERTVVRSVAASLRPSP